MNTNVTCFQRRSELVKNNKMSFHVALEDLEEIKEKKSLHKGTVFYLLLLIVVKRII